MGTRAGYAENAGLTKSQGFEARSTTISRGPGYYEFTIVLLETRGSRVHNWTAPEQIRRCLPSEQPVIQLSLRLGSARRWKQKQVLHTLLQQVQGNQSAERYHHITEPAALDEPQCQNPEALRPVQEPRGQPGPCRRGDGASKSPNLESASSASHLDTPPHPSPLPH